MAVLLCLLHVAGRTPDHGFTTQESIAGCPRTHPELNGACPEDPRWEAALARAPAPVARTPTTPAASNAHAERCASDDWRCLCRATPHHHASEDWKLFPHDESTGRVLEDLAKNTSEHAARRVRTAAASAGGSVAAGLDAICPHGRVYNALADYVSSTSIKRHERDDGSPRREHALSRAHELQACRPHLPIFRAFPPVAPKPGAEDARDSSPTLAREWLGTVRKWHWDCEANTYWCPYAAFSPMRAVDCVRGAPPGASVSPPVVDEEYFELSDVLLSVAAAPKEDKYIIVEVGARYAPWAVRALAAARLLGRKAGDFFAVLLEPMPPHIRWIHQHMRMNGFAESDYRVHHAKFGMKQREGRGGKTAPWYGLAELLDGLPHIDMLDMDAQNGELHLVQSAADSAALRKVRRAHIEAHTDETARIVVKTLEEHGFRVLRNTSRLYQVYKTAVGPVHYRGGSVYAVNTNAPNTLGGEC